MVMSMNAVAARRAGKSLRLTLPAHHPASLVATCFNIGHLPVIRTNTHLGSLAMSLLTPFLMWAVLLTGGFWWAVLFLLLGNFFGTWALMVVEADGNPANHDSRAVVIDEFVGAGLASLMLPWLWADLGVVALDLQLASCLMVGLIFRILDITKLFPASTIDLHWHHPYSVIADDVVAGLQTMLVLTAFCLIV